ncbi:hypothetical protein QFC22_004396 [Naganishia vaughanmartiniae]|uniref:Uncharacterized protein n=1 Tax=Naganishia vaughanmartiniae TaxID=1424756 RepID=A0ACC2X1P8_9TREE|nr:hypothetical protein QFC22_004396 [Naganishia vaughanmartiniae]
MRVPVVQNEGDQSVILRDALRMAMTMSSESMPTVQSDIQTPSDQLPSWPSIHANNQPAIAPSSRSSSPSGSTTPLSLSLSTPASPVSLSSVPASMALSMDLDSDDMDTSTTWSLYGSSEEDSRAGSPAARTRRAADGPNPRASDVIIGAGGRFGRRMESDEAETIADPPRIGRVPHPYAITRRNTATIPALIRRNTSTTTRARDDAALSSWNEILPGSLQSDRTTTTVMTGNDTHSRSHWAIQESLDRQRYQGDLFDLVLPVLELPGASVSTTLADSSHRPRSGQNDVFALKNDSVIRAAPTTVPAGSKSREQDVRSSSVLSVVLCGTNRTTNTFLRELMRDSRFEVYKFPATTSTRLAASTPGPRSTAIQNKNDGSTRSTQPLSTRADGQDAKAAYYTVGVYVVGTSPKKDGGGSTAEGKKLVARIKVFGKGQYSNLDNAISHIKHTYTRLDSLLRPPMKEEEDPGSLGSSDMYGLVESWVWGPAASGVQNEDVKEADWCELAILTGDGRHLLGKACVVRWSTERSQMQEIIAMVPTLCYPKDLSSLLSLASGLDFYTPESQSSGTRPSSRQRSESDISQVADLLLAIANEASETNGTHRQLRKSGVRSFLQWRSSNLHRSHRESTILGTSHGAASANLPLPSQSKKLSTSRDRTTEEPSPIERRPIPTLARARGSYEGQPGNWEAGLSRRVAERRDADKERLAVAKRKKLRADASTLGTSGSAEKPSAQDRSGFFDDRRCAGEGYAASARIGGLGVIKGLRAGWDIVKAFVYPLSLIQGVIWPETTGGAKGFGGWGIFKVACVGLVFGLAGLWLSRS